MKTYCQSCGAATYYTYSAGKPSACGTCHKAFEPLSVPLSHVAAAPVARPASQFDWTKKIKFDDVFSVQAVEVDRNWKLPKEE